MNLLNQVDIAESTRWVIMDESTLMSQYQQMYTRVDFDKSNMTDPY